MDNLSPLEMNLLKDCANGKDIRSSGRPEDRAKQRLRRLGLVAYVGKPRRWQVSAEGLRVARSETSQ